MQMPGRRYYQSATKQYRFGFNGKEEDDEVKGDGMQQDYGMRIYDTRIGKLLSLDPIRDEYPGLTPYQFASNRPIDGIDQLGLQYIPTNESIIFISARLFQFNGKTVLHGSVHLQMEKIKSNTKAFIQNCYNCGFSAIATFKHGEYDKMMENKLAEALGQKYNENFLLKTAGSGEISTPTSLTQPEIEVQRNYKNKKELREAKKEAKKTGDHRSVFWTPSGVAKGQATGNALVTAVGVAVDIIKYNQSGRIQADYDKGKSQTIHVSKVLDYIQYGLDHNLITGTYLNDNFISQFANYLLDGTVPTKRVDFKNEKGEDDIKFVTDNSTLQNIEKLDASISNHKAESTKQTGPVKL